MISVMHFGIVSYMQWRNSVQDNRLTRHDTINTCLAASWHTLQPFPPLLRDRMDPRFHPIPLNPAIVCFTPPARSPSVQSQRSALLPSGLTPMVRVVNTLLRVTSWDACHTGPYPRMAALCSSRMLYW